MNLLLPTGAHAIAAARELLHKDDSDPRDVYLFIEIDFGSLSEGDIESLHNQWSSCGTGETRH